MAEPTALTHPSNPLKPSCPVLLDRPEGTEDDFDDWDKIKTDPEPNAREVELAATETTAPDARDLVYSGYESYRRWVGMIPLLSEAQMDALFARRDQLRERLVRDEPHLLPAIEKIENEIAEGNLRLVIWVAKNRFPTIPNYPFLDQIQDGTIFGLRRAVVGFDRTKGVKFSTYAVRHIAGAISRRIREYNLIYRSNLENEHLFRVNRELARGEGFDDPEIMATNLGLPVEKVLILIEASRRGGNVSLDTPIGDEKDSPSIGDQMSDAQAEIPSDETESALDASLLAERAQKFEDSLPKPAEKAIFRILVLTTSPPSLRDMENHLRDQLSVEMSYEWIRKTRDRLRTSFIAYVRKGLRSEGSVEHEMMAAPPSQARTSPLRKPRSSAPRARKPRTVISTSEMRSLLRAQDTTAIVAFRAALKPRQQLILDARYLNDDDSPSNEELGARFKVGPESIRQDDQVLKVLILARFQSQE